MTRLFALLVFASACDAPRAQETAVTKVPQVAPECASARAKLEAVLAAFPLECTGDADCDGHYWRTSACAPAVVVAKAGVTEPRLEELRKAQAPVRTACPPDPVACEPIPFDARCVEHRCVDRTAR